MVFQGGQNPNGFVSAKKGGGWYVSFQKIPNKICPGMTKNNSVGIRNAMILVDGELKSGHHQRMKKGVIVISDSSFQKNFNIQ